MTRLRAATRVGWLVGLALAASAAAQDPAAPTRRTFYVRQTVGEDSQDGLTPRTAWRTLSRLSERVQAGDVVYVGPGLYREGVNVMHAGNASARIVFAADPSGGHTGDPPGAVLVTGAEPVDETRFQATETRGVYQLHVPEFRVLGVVEMDGRQSRYGGVLEPVVGPPPLERVKTTRARFFYDPETKQLHIHTSDDRAPTGHEIELIRRHSGFFVVRQPWVSVVGFTFRHFGDAPINFRFAPHGAAIGNVAWGSRQGIRVRQSEDVLLQGNTLFRNDNSGAYFLSDSVGAVAIGNVAYENAKGLRWGSGSNGGLALDNLLLRNLDAGLALEQSAGTVARGNRLASNGRTQLLLHESEALSDQNCFELGGGSTSLAERYGRQSWRTLAEYQQATRLDADSREGGCGKLPEPIDVGRLHRDSLSYVEAARRRLATRRP